MLIIMSLDDNDQGMAEREGEMQQDDYGYLQQGPSTYMESHTLSLSNTHTHFLSSTSLSVMFC